MSVKRIQLENMAYPKTADDEMLNLRFLFRFFEQIRLFKAS